MLLIGLLIFVILRALRAAFIARDTFGQLMAVGVAATLFLQAYINIGMQVGIMPVTGVVLPFISYGRSNLIVVLAAYKGGSLAFATWSAASFHIKDRDQFIGWSHDQCRRRRGLVANNSRLLVMPDCHYPNLVSRFMKLMLKRLSEDWLKRWGHPIALVETFVDPRSDVGPRV